MAMDIKTLSQMQPRATTDARQGAGAKKTPDAGAEAARASVGSKGDQVTLTDTARLLGELTRSAGNQPVVDSQRVSDIRQAIEEGRYEVNAERVAAKLMQSDALL